MEIGVGVIDSYTHHVLDFMENINKTFHLTMADLFATYDPHKLGSTPGIRSDLFHRDLDKTLITDFFGGVSRAEVVDTPPPETDLFSTEVVPPEQGATPANGIKPVLLLPPTSQAGDLRAWFSLLLIALIGFSVHLFGDSKQRVSSAKIANGGPVSIQDRMYNITLTSQCSQASSLDSTTKD